MEKHRRFYGEELTEFFQSEPMLGQSFLNVSAIGKPTVRIATIASYTNYYPRYS